MVRYACAFGHNIFYEYMQKRCPKPNITKATDKHNLALLFKKQERFSVLRYHYNVKRKW